MQSVQALLRVTAWIGLAAVAGLGACTARQADPVPRSDETSVEAASAEVSARCADVALAYESCEVERGLDECLDPRDGLVDVDALRACCAESSQEADDVCRQIDADCGDEVSAFEHCEADFGVAECLDTGRSNEHVDPYVVHACCESTSFATSGGCQLIDSTCQIALGDPESDAKLVSDCCEKPNLSESPRCQALDSTCEATLDDFEACEQDLTVEECLTRSRGEGSLAADSVHGCCERRDLADADVCISISDVCRGALVELGACAMDEDGGDCLSDATFVEACCAQPMLSGTEVCQFVGGEG